MRSYDLVFHVIAVGDSVLFGSSTDDSLHSLDAATGKQKWSFCTGGPVRVAPTYSEGKVYFGSDDGHAYCLRAVDGVLVWKYRPTENNRLVLNNGRFISFWPCRTGVLVEDGIAYFAASLLPWKASYLCAVDAETGLPEGKGRYVRKFDRTISEITLEGSPAASSRLLIFPQGRIAPRLFDRSDGKDLGNLKKGGGGSIVVLNSDSQIHYGPGANSRVGSIDNADVNTREQIASYEKGSAIVIAGNMSYMLSDKSLIAFDWAQRKNLWKVSSSYPYALILAGDTLFAGGRDEVAAFRAEDGQLLWTHPVAGNAYGLAAAGGRLLVSTDAGAVYAFGPSGDGSQSQPIARAEPEPQSTEQPAADMPNPIVTGPWLQFTGHESAIVRWYTRNPSPSILEYQSADISPVRIEDSALKTEHQVTLTALVRDRVYSYQISSLIEGNEYTTSPQQCDTFFNYNLPGIPDLPNPFPAGQAQRLCAQTAEQILSQTGVSQGICLVLGCADGRFVYELARRSRLRVIGVDTDAAKVAAARDALQRGGVYGARASVHHVDRLAELPFPGHFANLIVSQRMLTEGECIGSAAEVFRMLRPGGGIAYLGQPLGAPQPLSRQKLQAWLDAASVKATISDDDQGVWARIGRGPLPGAGQWSHMYGRADNSAFGGETLAGATDVGELEVQWLGRPGPRYQADRQGRKPAPLSTSGRLYLQGLHRIVTLDAYNGVVLWSLEIPALERFNMPHDCSNWCADEDHLFTAIGGRCWQIDTVTAEVSKMYDVIAGLQKDWEYDWGYVACHGDNILGSAVKKGTFHTNFWGHYDEGLYDGVEGAAAAKVCSDNLFTFSKRTGAAAWTYTDGVIINSTITIGAGRVYFVETRNAKVKASSSRRVSMPEMWLDQFLVALDVDSGAKVWQRAIDTADGDAVMFLAHSKERLVLVSSGGPPTGNKNQYGEILKQHYIYAYDPSNGEAKWDSSFEWSRPRKAEHMSRPIIVGETLFIWPHVLNLTTGKVLPQRMPVAGFGCGTSCAVSQGLFMGNTWWNAKSEKVSTWPRLRSSCWLSTIPAAGMLLSPEGGGGCSCGTWMETSIGFMPVARPRNLNKSPGG